VSGIGLRCDGLEKRFATDQGKIVALRDVAFRVAPGEFVSLLGPSGCGKTTLLRIVAGLLRPSAGSVEFDGLDDRSRPPLALVFQEHGLFPWMTVTENVAFALEDRVPRRRERLERARQLVEQVGLGRFGGLFPGQLSRGMSQRVNLARGFAREPRLLLLDEPFASLDSLSRGALQDELLAFLETMPTTVLLVTHDIEEAALLADRVLVFSPAPGRVVEEVTVELPRPRDLGDWASEPVRSARLHLWRRLGAAARRDLELPAGARP